MARHLERDLGLVATTTVSIGAMIGSGIFVLPGLAFATAGPAVILAYFLAGTIVLPADPSSELVAATEDFLADLERVASVPVEWDLLRTDDRVDALADAATGADLVVLGTAPHSWLYRLLFGDVSTAIGDRVDGSLLFVYPDESGTGTFLRKLLERVAFGTRGDRSPTSSSSGD